MGAFWSQLIPPAPSFTEANIPSLDGRVFIVTGGNAGIGFELVKMLYAKGGCTIYIASRTGSRIATAIKEIESTVSTPRASPAKLKSLVVDFGNLETISKAASEFLEQETRLDVLWNNAGIAQAPPGSTTAQGYEAHMGTNCLGPYLFTKLLLPILLQTARTAPTSSVRVIFTASQIVDTTGPPGGLLLAEQEPGKHNPDKNWSYSASKVGNWFLASELDKRARKDGLVSVVQNPGNIATKAWDPVSWFGKLLISPFLYDAKHGAYTELWTGLSEDVTTHDGGKFGVPWGGRWHPNPRKDILESLKPKEEGGTGLAAEFWDWCEKQTAPYAL
ncbi:NAD(P)-binding protein [Periconia macrospinosa]|uniref:NAD(P)-binding protein n=1 Tax=Periconia macrospinosa TaxID=97972 RepID=A0A2V1DJG0_9PLEO|nr:NAD(P)-binding protein [Periconia macrospinosa]